jgi:glycosyltransferase involved in cell wall biosynthesis
MSPKNPTAVRVLCLIARLNVGGPAKYVGWLMKGLDSQRFQQVLVAGQVGLDEDDMGGWFRRQGIDYLTQPGLGRALNPLQDLRALAGILGVMSRERPHLVATQTSKAGFLGRLAVLLYRPYARLRGWPAPRVIHTFHGHTFHSYFGPFKAGVFLWLERFMARRATDRIVVISPRQLEEIHGVYRVGREDQMALAPVGVDLAPFARPQEGRKRFRAELGAGSDELLIGAVGRVAPVKNYGLFLQVAANLKESRPDLWQRVRFLIIGGGAPEDMKQLAAQAGVLGLGHGVAFLGNRSDPQDFFPGLDLLLLTSLNEGTPLSILEGGACGLPVAATQVGGVPDLLGDEKAGSIEGCTVRERGLTAASGDAPSLARGIAWLLDNPDRARELGQRLSDYVTAEHSLEKLLSTITGLYEEVLERR